MTPASGADRCPVTGTCARTDCTPTWCHLASGTASGADQPTLRDQLLARLLTEYRRMWNPAELHEIVDDLLPLVERAKAEGGAEALEKAADEQNNATVSRVSDWLRDRAAALRGET